MAGWPSIVIAEQSTMTLIKAGEEKLWYSHSGKDGDYYEKEKVFGGFIECACGKRVTLRVWRSGTKLRRQQK